MNSIAETVALLVKPPTLEVMRLRPRGMLAAKGAVNQTPTILPQGLEFGTVMTTIIPMRETMTKPIITTSRQFLRYVTRRLEIRRAISWTAPEGIWTSSALRLLKPKPVMMMLLNCADS